MARESQQAGGQRLPERCPRDLLPVAAPKKQLPRGVDPSLVDDQPDPARASEEEIRLPVQASSSRQSNATRDEARLSETAHLLEQDRLEPRRRRDEQRLSHPADRRAILSSTRGDRRAFVPVNGSAS